MAILPENLAIIIAGPTASGKSCLALDLAKAYDGVIINADSIQLYQDLPVLSAQPSHDDFQQAPHHLYGVLPAEKNYTAALWCEMAASLLEECRRTKQMPLIVGGTGFYLKALMEGLSSIPSIPPEIRHQTIARCHEIGLENLFKEVKSFDPDLAKRLNIHDKQRIMRAWEVYHATGKPLSFWQLSPRIPWAPAYHFLPLCLDPVRESLQIKAALRIDKMIEKGALEEVKSLLDRHISRTSPIFKTLGALQLADYLEGLISLDNALEQTKKTTYAYIKRQQTWFRHQLVTPYRIHDFYCKETSRYVQSVIKEWNNERFA